jgi:transcriptional regulator with XRE-family HTH domain
VKIEESPEYSKIIEELREWCKAQHGRQKELADGLGISKQLVSSWLTQGRKISLNQWIKIQEWRDKQKKASRKKGVSSI